jgi:predicted Rossmann fold flavoprotein
MHTMKRIIIIGGGAAGCFAAIQAASAGAGQVEVTLLEGGRELLNKVRVSGGGRCNVTHSCFDPRQLVLHYPRGSRELLGPFHQFQPRDMIDWLGARGVELKTEEDGRMFPVTDQSATIIDCLQKELRRHQVRVWIGKWVKSVERSGDGWNLETTDGRQWEADACMIAVGSMQNSPMSSMLTSLGHTIAPLAPSLFAFNIADRDLCDLAGVSVGKAQVTLVGGEGLEQRGPLLVTHKGISGPAVLKLSAWGARELARRSYQFTIHVDWLGGDKAARAEWPAYRKQYAKKKVVNQAPAGIPLRLWKYLLQRSYDSLGISSSELDEQTWAHVSHAQMSAIERELTACEFEVTGKSTHKEEFVTCGGVSLKEVNFKTMESRIAPNLYFGGECLDIDGITGGFNFQAAWTTGYLAGTAMASLDVD